VGEPEFTAGAGVGAGVWLGVEALFCLVLVVVEPVRLEVRARGRGCAKALIATISKRKKTKGDFVPVCRTLK